MQIQPSLFPYTLNCQDVECCILSFLPKKALLTCAKVSKAWCDVLDSMAQPYVLGYLDMIKVMPEINSVLKRLHSGFYANIILCRLGVKPYPLLEIYANQVRFLGKHKPWIYLALHALETNDMDKFHSITNNKIKLFKGSLTAYFIERLCKKEKLKEAIDFHKKHYHELLHLPSMISSQKLITESIIKQKKYDLMPYMADQIVPESERDDSYYA